MFNNNFIVVGRGPDGDRNTDSERPEKGRGRGGGRTCFFLNS